MKRTLRTLSKAMFTTVIGVSLLAPSAALAAEHTSGSQTVTAVSPNASADSKTANSKPKYTEDKAKISKEQAVSLTRKLFPKLKDAEAQSVQFGINNQYPRPDMNVWTIDWQLKTTNNGSHGFNSTIAADTGDLLSMYVPYMEEDRNQTYYPPKVTKDQAREIAKSFIVQASPSLSAKDLVEGESPFYAYDTALFGPVNYSFQYDVLVNGVAVKNGGINVNIDGDGNVMRFFRQALVSEYPSSTPKVTLEQATKYAKEHQSAELQYILDRRTSGVPTSYLGYVPVMTPIDAQTGHFVENGMGYEILSRNYKNVPATEHTYTGKSDKADLTAEQAAKLVEDAFGIPKEKKLLRQSFQADWGNINGKLWQLNWGDEEQGRGFGFDNQINAAVQAQMGYVSNYFNNQYSPNNLGSKQGSTLPAISREEAEKRVIILLNQVYPNASKELKQVVIPETTSKNTPTNYQFNFQRFYKGIPISGDTVNVNMDLQGNISNYFVTRNELNEKYLDNLKPKITMEQALEKIWKNTKLELQFLPSGGYYEGNPQESAAMNLAYSQSLKENPNTTIIDAVEGTWKKQWYGMPDASRSSVKPVDVTGHWAQKELETLVQYKVLSTDDAGKVNPNQVITSGDWWTMMMKAISPQYLNYGGSNEVKQPFADVDEKSPYYDAVRFGVQFKWLKADASKKLEADQELTREAFATNLIKVAKYSKLTTELATKIPSLPYSDASQIANKGDVWLAVQLGLLKTKDGKFNPKDKVTKADAAVAIMNLVYLQGKLDQSVSSNYPF
ncbi:YcdB/YcdC domain-containing protein [Paenibacillus sp. KN14-4R]|uniref:YcdB/YcdC domain-containing protein n=1 Tax=Paenibacillus sp. KN14-4R TaxID=3445773 RepID=UPI003FA09D8E